MKPPTGTPTVPKAVQLAKDVQDAIINKAQTSVGTENEEFLMVETGNGEEGQDMEPGADGAVAVKKEGIIARSKFVKKSTMKKNAEAQLMEAFVEAKKAKGVREEKRMKHEAKQQQKKEDFYMKAITRFGKIFAQALTSQVVHLGDTDEEKSDSTSDSLDSSLESKKRKRKSKNKRKNKKDKKKKESEKEVTVIASSSDNNDNNDESLSTIDSADSPPTKKLKEDRKKEKMTKGK